MATAQYLTPASSVHYLIGQNWNMWPALATEESGKLSGLTDSTVAPHSKIKVLLVWKKQIMNSSVGSQVCKGQKHKHISSSETSLSLAMFLLVCRLALVTFHASANPSQFNLTTECQRPCITFLLPTPFPGSHVPGIF